MRVSTYVLKSASTGTRMPTLPCDAQLPIGGRQPCVGPVNAVLLSTSAHAVHVSPSTVAHVCTRKDVTYRPYHEPSCVVTPVTRRSSPRSICIQHEPSSGQPLGSQPEPSIRETGVHLALE